MATAENSDININGPIVHKPAPWQLKCPAIYMIPFYTSAQTAANLPAKAYSPLEAASAFASKEHGPAVGGISMIQLLRYSESPVGPYDEMILCPGYFEYPVEGKDGEKRKKKATRITRIYVSQKQTCWNGRSNFNIPKHLARFEWSDNPDGSTHIKVFPHDFVTPNDASEAKPSESPFFQCTIKPISYAPSFPFSTAWFKYLGIDESLVHPPLPHGESQELAGTDRWCKLAGFSESSNSGRLAWADMSQRDEDGVAPDEFENFFPGLRRWNLAVKLTDATVFFPPPETWETPKWLA
ncbi:hypothetical protein QBC34DRAFT_134525 [Podospora aff. communis PSN243]|uniref:Uncharacterized protein n=1 Tax=Podospora aff. communis PSN243 TaxID=3040156 RepID=A0AAV9H3F7_9PEZI|nr:hypothetical protein QBC34DRAFT_134525 [Podospora aff. communis PSN243]